jgi:hypothetical protein
MQNISCIHSNSNDLRFGSTDFSRSELTNHQSDKADESLLCIFGSRRNLSPQETLRGSLLSSCLYGSPDRRQAIVDDITIQPLRADEYLGAPTFDSTSPILKMLGAIKSEISKLKSSQRVAGEPYEKRASIRSPSLKSRQETRMKAQNPLMDRMNEIEILLLETEESLGNMASRLDSTETRIRNRTAMLWSFSCIFRVCICVEWRTIRIS